MQGQQLRQSAATPPEAPSEQVEGSEPVTFGGAAALLAKQNGPQGDQAVEWAEQAGQRLVPFIAQLFATSDGLQDQLLQLAVPAVNDETPMTEISDLLEQGMKEVVIAAKIDASFVKAIASNFAGLTMAVQKVAS